MLCLLHMKDIVPYIKEHLAVRNSRYFVLLQNGREKHLISGTIRYESQVLGRCIIQYKLRYTRTLESYALFQDKILVSTNCIKTC